MVNVFKMYFYNTNIFIGKNLRYIKKRTNEKSYIVQGQTPKYGSDQTAKYGRDLRDSLRTI